MIRIAIKISSFTTPTTAVSQIQTFNNAQDRWLLKYVFLHRLKCCGVKEFIFKFLHLYSAVPIIIYFRKGTSCAIPSLRRSTKQNRHLYQREQYTKGLRNSSQFFRCKVTPGLTENRSNSDTLLIVIILSKKEGVSRLHF